VFTCLYDTNLIVCTGLKCRSRKPQVFLVILNGKHDIDTLKIILTFHNLWKKTRNGFYLILLQSTRRISISQELASSSHKYSYPYYSLIRFQNSYSTLYLDCTHDTILYHNTNLMIQILLCLPAFMIQILLCVLALSADLESHRFFSNQNYQFGGYTSASVP
jgi:hypothetical protein